MRPRLGFIKVERTIPHEGVRAAWEGMLAADQDERTPKIHYTPCTDHEAAVEVEGYCPCWDGLHIDWTKTLGGT